MMTGYELSQHAWEIVKERGIREAWVRLTLEEPDRKEARGNGTIHYTKAIREHGGRYLRVVVNPNFTPEKVVTLFFDRQLGRLP